MAKAKYDWYQTETAVTVTVLLKNAVEKNYSVQLEQNSCRLQADDIEPILLNLWNPINVEQSTHKSTPSKVEIKMAKLIGQRWDALERKTAVEASSTSSSVKKRHDWDKISKELENEEQGEKDDVTDLFKKIYADANEDTKKAMMKSYYESGGTVLSTNWSEVGAKNVDVKPPDGCEFKKWQ